MQPGSRIVRMWCRLAAARRGATSIEFAFATTFILLPLVAGVTDLGMGLYVQMQVGNSARAGAEFATYCHCADDQTILPVVQTSIESAEQSATGLGTAITAHTAQFCGCILNGTNTGAAVTINFGDGNFTTVDGITLAPSPLNSVYPDPIANGSTLPSCVAAPVTYCPDDSLPGTYVTVTASTTYTPWIRYPGIVPDSGFFTLRGDATARIY